MYHALGLADVGATLSCQRDYALAQGFNPAIQLERTHTIMEGASHCDFRFRLEAERAPANDANGGTDPQNEAGGVGD